MEQKRESEIDPLKYNKLIFERRSEVTNSMGKIWSFIKIAGSLGKGKKLNLDTEFTKFVTTF